MYAAAPIAFFFSFVSFWGRDVRAYASTRYSPRTGINKSAIIVSSSIPLGDSLTQTGSLKVERLGFDLYTALVSMSSPERGGQWEPSQNKKTSDNEVVR